MLAAAQGCLSGCLAVAANDSPLASVLVVSAVLIVVLVVAFLGYVQLKRWMGSSDDEPADGFTFGGLRELHRAGKLSDAEYEMARAQLKLTTSRAAGTLPDPMAKPSRR